MNLYSEYCKNSQGQTPRVPSNLDTFEFIHTSKIYQNEEAEIQKWNNMWKNLIDNGNKGLVDLFSKKIRE